ncbi:sushi, nidogen and EGF-like domain-containing protein 1 [Haliotis asinina]|uniref:sushi, nidogen and EGF-like domain-containing protein 1 n=1 Tax=Haliotis asinina TaxID=109174 RepID=UPI00353183FA
MLWLILVAVIPIAACQRTDKWDSCGCHWDTWQAWSKCSSRCYGRQVRERKVWHHNTPECEGFEACDGGRGGYVRRDCNNHCDAGYYNGYRCSCPMGRYGECCGSIVICAKPASIPHGDVHGDRYQYDDVITYTCDANYNLTGPYERKCMVNGGWSRSTPRCLFAESCKSDPCQNGGTCVDGLDRYDCVCGRGWTGKNCDVDVQAPVVDQCPSSVRLTTSSREVTYTWTVPVFSDPHGNPVITSSDYDSNNFTFPWGDFTVLYTAVKPSNGLETNCSFTISARPKPCPSIVSPINGYVLCNGWRADYGQYCLVGCNTNYSLPRSFDARQWIVCGASGHWTPDSISQRCKAGDAGGHLVLTPGDCHSGTQRQKEDYIHALKRSSFNSVCIDNPAICSPDNVNVVCGA